MKKYRPSTARLEFEKSVKEISSVLPLVMPRRKVDAELRNYVLGAAVLFLSAKLENYISDLFVGICQKICTNCTDASQIPAPLLGWVFLADGHLERSRSFIARNDEHVFIARTGEYLGAQLLSDPAAILQASKFKGIDDKSYPSVKNIKKMFRRIGIDAIFTRLSSRLKRNVENEISSLNNVRGSLAHVGISGTISYTETKDRLIEITQIVAAIDKEVFYHLRSVCPTDVWKS